MKKLQIVLKDKKFYWKDDSGASCGENRIDYRYIGDEKTLRPVFEYCERTNSNLSIDILNNYVIPVDVENKDFVEVAIVEYKQYDDYYDVNILLPKFVEYTKISKEQYDILVKYIDHRKYQILLKPDIIDIAGLLKDAEEKKLSEEKRLEAAKQKKKKTDEFKKKKKIESILSEPELVEQLKDYLANKSYWDNKKDSLKNYHDDLLESQSLDYHETYLAR